MNIFNTTIPSESLIEYIPTCLLATIPMNIQFAYLDFLKVIQCYHNLTPDPSWSRGLVYSASVYKSEGGGFEPHARRFSRFL